MEKLNNFLQSFFKKNIPGIRSGDTVVVYQKIKEGNQERVQAFEGLVLARKHGKEAGATITVRKIVSGVGVEKIFPLHSPTIEKIEIIKRGKTRRSKLYYLRTAKGKKARLKKQEFTEVMPAAEPTEEETPIKETEKEIKPGGIETKEEKIEGEKPEPVKDINDTKPEEAKQ